jgi:hypothetical protein
MTIIYVIMFLSVIGTIVTKVYERRSTNMVGDITDCIIQLEENMMFIGETDYKITEQSDSKANIYFVHNLDAYIEDERIVFFDENELIPDDSILRSFMINSIYPVEIDKNKFIINFKSGQVIIIERIN